MIINLLNIGFCYLKLLALGKGYEIFQPFYYRSIIGSLIGIIFLMLSSYMIVLGV